MPDLRALENLRTVRDLIRWGASEFVRAGLVFGHGSDNALDEAFHLVVWKLALPFDLPEIYLKVNLAEHERVSVIELLEARVLTRKPAAYLTGEAWFCGLPFHVDERVLIPRSPIGELIEQDFSPWLPRAPGKILDLCSGSGCIGIACALQYPSATVDLAEIDEGAIALMERNVLRHGVGDRVSLMCGDLFEPLDGRRYDLIVTNPPYVPHEEWQSLAPEYRHEPRRALEAGADGMNIVARILAHAPEYLGEGGMLICEIGGSQMEFEERFPRIPVSWIEFDRGGDGVFVISREDLARWQSGHAAKKT